ncbi:MAG: precorrin-4 C(11)-methyltransferase [Methylococcales symbiont of Iophon sp. n. MRB-2018]|nr:MAG: precorrin-4 C(11)-methyltransferase [Methylococcales symbiont of Iophon sp. n. MRB-2018]KAF3980635.1 MAG: precorrin-4 C(11)-methyltransferase [Methylococcales symbiont of Iophon sp. n. MRB-2018]
MPKIWFVGAGPGDPELLTLKAQRLIKQADAILFAGSLVSKTAMTWASECCDIQDSKGMTLKQICDWLINKAKTNATVIRLQTGDPSLYGALIEMIQPLDKAGIDVAVVPGVTSAMASAAAAVETLSLPEVTQTVIFSRVEGRTPMPEGESLEDLARHHCTLCLYLSITLLKKIQTALIAAGWAEEATILVVHKASWPGEEQIIRGTLSNIREKCKQAGINSQAMIIASPTLGARNWTELAKSKLYDASFAHRFRKAEKS